MPGDCPIGADRPLLIYVSNLSGGLRQDACVKTGPKLMFRADGAAGFALAVSLAAMWPATGRADEHEQEELHRAVERGDIRSLADNSPCRPISRHWPSCISM